MILERDEVDRERERERERERNIDQLVVSFKCPDWGSNPQPRYVS